MRWILKVRIFLLQLAVVFIVCSLVFGFGMPGDNVSNNPDVERRIEIEHRITAVESRLADMAWMQRAALAGVGGLLLEMLFRMKRGERS